MHVVESADAPQSPGRAGPAPGVRPRTRLADLAALIRPSHAAKAILLVPIALVAASPWRLAEVGGIALATLAFILASAAVYIGNDIADRHRDRHHPVKCRRPIAAGRVGPLTACLYCGVLLALLGAIVAREPGAYWPVLVYLALNVAYSRHLKHLPLVDVGTVAFGFVLRVVQGYEVTGGPVAAWLLVAVFSMSLLLLLGKRRQELLETGAAHRPALRGYSMELTNWLLQIASVLALISGLMYLRDEGPFGPEHGQTAMLLSTPFALLALFRYLQIQLVDEDGGDPVRVLLRDRVMVANAVVWAATLGVTLLLARNTHL
ncbi:4-hydroxybenzoate polyprenyltransferase [Thermocatellispora tengchongensis]|uniref:4-hydroxybenzoate polyprenyltransferase n=1 Tax=Thermocatellispora tengchongensis TaxID=1073253 RepID=A0A840PBK7_9ACTN|nr:UbiA prenyltransferase family protein [Thermocatellispora tengchongensis]MBB5134567.1 4-hydroxybenzoate polyprenyltransferase [Thermocatellispora tengchongensis]